MLRVLVIVALALLSLAPRPVLARASSRVGEVKRLYDQLYYDDAAKVCQAVLEAGRNTRNDLVQLLLLSGLLAGVQERIGDAIASFKQALVIDPLVKLGREHPPRVQRAFSLARAWFRQQKPLMIEVRAPERADRGGPVPITLSVVSDPLGMISRAVLHARASTTAGFRSQVISRGAVDEDSRWLLDLPSLDGVASAGTVQYYVTVLDASYNEVAVVGSSLAPRRLMLEGGAAPPATRVTRRPPRQDRPPPPVKKPWFRQWWLWTAVGAVLTATVVAVGVAAGGPDDRVDAPIVLVPEGAR